MFLTKTLIRLLFALSLSVPSVQAFATSAPPHALADFSTTRRYAINGDDDKFSFGQRIESLKTGVAGLLAGGIALAPFSALHDLLFADATLVRNGFAQWEFDTDMGSLESALFAIVYRYCVRADDNEQLNQGCLGAFVLTRTLSKIQTPTYCTAAPLDCGSPLGYFDWSMITQGVFIGIESVALFGGAAIAIEYCFRKGLISKFGP